MQAVTERQKLTVKQQAIYEFIREEITIHHVSPTFREIGEQFEIRSSNGVMCHMRALESKGWIQRDPYLSRGIALVPEPRAQIAALSPGEAVCIGEVYVYLQSIDPENCVTLEVIAPDTMGELSKDV